MNRIVAAMGEAGIKVIMGTPIFARSLGGASVGYGTRQNMNTDDPNYRRYAERLIVNMVRAYSTRSTYTDILDFHVVPKWGEKKLHEVRAVAVEKWLRQLKLARGSKAKIRSIMSVLFNHAIRREFLPQARTRSRWCGRAGSGCGPRIFWRLTS